MKRIAADWRHRDAMIETPFEFSSGHQVDLVYVRSIHALNQIVGYLKYINNDDARIYYRGQSKLYPTLTASIYRSSQSNASISKRNYYIADYIKACKTKMPIIAELPEYAREPLFQHYGIQTKWIDLVDNLWVAIWFGLHEYHSNYLDRNYEFVYQRNDDEGFLYILLIGNDAMTQKDNCPGLYTGSMTRVIDLRISTPSIFLRPHCQHALLMRSKSSDTLDVIDLSRYIVLIIKLQVKDAIDWIGSGRLITAENIYPSPLYDLGYGLLLEQAPHNKSTARTLGSIKNITYAMPRH